MQMPLQPVDNIQLFLSRLPKGPWTKQLKDLPKGFSEEKILQHEHSHGANKHSVSGYRMFKSEKVHEVLLCKAVDGETVVLKAMVEASFSVGKSYKAAAALTSAGNVKEAGCECRAGASGVCKHVAALLWFMLDMKRSQAPYVRDTVACTEKSRTWGSGSKDAHVRKLKFSDLQFVKHLPTKAKVPVKPKRNVPVIMSESDLKELHKGLQHNNINMMLCQVLEENCFVPVPLPVINEKPLLPTLPLRLPTKILWSEYVPTSYEIGTCSLTLEEAWALEEATRAQSNSAAWAFERSKRLTASHFGDIMSRQKLPDEKFCSRVFGTSHLQTKHMAFGLENEENAVHRYLKKKNSAVSVYHCGLCVNPGVPVLGATPDRVVQEGHSFGLLEIKTLAASKDRGEHLEEAIAVAPFLKNGTLRQSHKYFYQVQGQMALSGLVWCDFVVDNGTDCTFQRIEFDRSLWLDKMMPRLLEFYQSYRRHSGNI